MWSFCVLFDLKVDFVLVGKRQQAGEISQLQKELTSARASANHAQGELLKTSEKLLNFEKVCKFSSKFARLFSEIREKQIKMTRVKFKQCTSTILLFYKLNLAVFSFEACLCFFVFFRIPRNSVPSKRNWKI